MYNAAVKTSGNYTLKIVHDEDAQSPREWDNLGKMVCWHRNYNFGDNHNFSEPIDFIRDLADSVTTIELIRYVREGSAKGLRFQKNDDDQTISLMSYWDFSKKWYEEYSAPLPLSESDSYLRNKILDNMEIDDLRHLAEQRNLIYPLFLYDHSVQSISMQSFIGRAHHADWDSMQVGFVYVSHADVAKEYGDASPENIERARKLLNAETETYDSYMRGECYGFQLFKDGVEQDSCWGFLGTFQEAKEAIREYLPEDAVALANEAEYGDDEDEYEPEDETDMEMGDDE